MNDTEKPNAAALIEVLRDCTLHAMSRCESEDLHDLLEGLKILIEEKWEEWDNG